MQQHEDIVHSDVFLRIMNNQKLRRLKRQYFYGILIYLAAMVIATVLMFYWFSVIVKAQEDILNQQTGRIAAEPVADDLQEQSEPLKTSMEIDSKDSYLLAKLAMAEAEGEDVEGKALVMLTVLNRVHSDLPYFPDTIEEVIFQDGAFTPISNGRWDRVEPDEECWEALELIQGKHWDESCGALYFERTTDTETWHARNLQALFAHGNHTFYKEHET